MAKLARAWVTELDVGHMLLLNKPGEVVAVTKGKPLGEKGVEAMFANSGRSRGLRGGAREG